MSGASRLDGVQAGRLAAGDYVRNFADLHPPLSSHEALVEADRCYFCHDAPCMTACPTSIDIPLFIREIAAANPKGAARTIFEQNILGGICARVCPTETLCEEVCVREAAEGQPVRIGLLQRHATDTLMATGVQPFARASESGKTVAVVGAGPAGLASAHRLAMKGHAVTLFEAKEKPGGLNEYGIAAYKTVDDFAAREVDYVLGIGGIELKTGEALGRELTLAELRAEHDAVFLGLGLGGVNALAAEGSDLEGVVDAISFIADLRQADDLGRLPVGRRVVVIGGGMTAIDVAVQARLLGAEEVTIVYRRDQDVMPASRYEQDLARSKGVQIRYAGRPVRLLGEHGKVRAVEFEYTQSENGHLIGAGETFTLLADTVFRAIGQRFEAGPLDGTLALDEAGRIQVDQDFRTSLEGCYAGGDCIPRDDDLTVVAVEHGKRAAEAIDRFLAD
jgi:glutamate synthase (NADPH/NADH) small chain